MSSEIDYGKLTRRIVFTENDHRHAQLVLKLKNMKIRQSDFFRHIITGLIEDEDRILSYVEEISKVAKTRKADKAKLRQKGQQKLSDFALSEEDIDDIFDMLEGEYPDL